MLMVIKAIQRVIVRLMESRLVSRLQDEALHEFALFIPRIVPNTTATISEINTEGISNLNDASIFVSITSLFTSKALQAFLFLETNMDLMLPHPAT